jgi:integrase
MPRQSEPHLVRHNNGYLYIHWTDPTPLGKRGRSRTETTGAAESAAAHRYFAQWLLTRQNAKIEPEKSFAVATLWDAYAAGHLADKVASDRAQRSWQNLEKHFGSLALSDVSHAAVQTYLKKRQVGEIGQPSLPQTVRRELGALIAAFNWCAHPARKLVPETALPHIVLPEGGQPRDRWLTSGEIRELLEAAAERRRGGPDRLSRCERFLWLAIETAARKTAICELTWDRVDMETNVIRYDVPGRRKTKKRRAAVPISTALRPVLERMFQEQKPKPGDLVMITASDPLGIVKRAADTAGLEDVSPHVLRHTAATHMVRRGIPLWKVAKILGNSLAMVERVYAHHCPDDLREAVDTITGRAMETGK